MSEEYDAAVEVRDAVADLNHEINERGGELISVLREIAESLRGIEQRLAYATVLINRD
jgi:hypothetical protein